MTKGPCATWDYGIDSKLFNCALGPNNHCPRSWMSRRKRSSRVKNIYSVALRSRTAVKGQQLLRSGHSQSRPLARVKLFILWNSERSFLFTYLNLANIYCITCLILVDSFWKMHWQMMITGSHSLRWNPDQLLNDWLLCNDLCVLPITFPLYNFAFLQCQ